MSDGELEVVITDRRVEGEGIVALDLGAKDGSELPKFEPGAHIDVFLAPGLVRQYSLCGSAATTSRYRIAVLREAPSRGGSAYVHDRLYTGETLRIGRPRNHFPLHGTAGLSVLLAGGIGVTPILCMADQLHRLGAEFRVHYCARSAQRAAFLTGIANSAFASRVRFHFDDGPAEQRMNLEEAIGTYRQEAHLYVCGPAGFMRAALDWASGSGWPQASVHHETFAAPIPDESSADQAFTIRLKRSGLTLRVPPDKSIVQVLQEAGIAIDVSCEQGFCGTCVTAVLEGEPDHRDSVLTDEERARNNQLTPCCSRSKTPFLTLDL